MQGNISTLKNFFSNYNDDGKYDHSIFQSGLLWDKYMQLQQENKQLQTQNNEYTKLINDHSDLKKDYHQVCTDKEFCINRIIEMDKYNDIVYKKIINDLITFYTQNYLIKDVKNIVIDYL